MAGVLPAAKEAKLFGTAGWLCSLLPRSAGAAQAGVGLDMVDHRIEIIEAEYPLELESRACFMDPDNVGLDPANYREANDDAVAALQSVGVIDHEAVGRQIAHMQMQIAVNKMLHDRGKIDRVTRGAAQLGYAEIGSNHHDLRSFPSGCVTAED
jgi:hypothetical protein